MAVAVASAPGWFFTTMLIWAAAQSALSPQARSIQSASPAPASAAQWMVWTAIPSPGWRRPTIRSEEHTSELQSLMRISYAVFCLKKKKTHLTTKAHQYTTLITTHNTNTHDRIHRT